MAKKETTQKKDYSIGHGPGLIQKAESLTKELLGAVRQLPRVNEEGSSECPFAEELYAKKEKVQKEAQSFLKELDEYSRWASDEITRYRDSLTVILAGKEALSNNNAINRFTEAEVKLAALARKLSRVRDQICEAFRRLQAAIKESSQKQFPGRIPREIPQFSIPGSSPQEQYKGSNHSGSALDDELKHIIMMDLDQTVGQ